MMQRERLIGAEAADGDPVLTQVTYSTPSKAQGILQKNKGDEPK